MTTIRTYQPSDAQAVTEIWNEVIADGTAFAEEEILTREECSELFAKQTCAAVAVDENGEILGAYILHPNYSGRLGHICNASFAVRKAYRGKHIGEKLVKDCVEQARNLGFRIMQFNAVIETNTHARHLYERLGFRQSGMIPRGFRMKDGRFENICQYYLEL
jgi:L-amino acid N-acyltransferase YncA